MSRFDYDNERPLSKFVKEHKGKCTIAIAVATLAGFACTRIHTATASQVLTRAGLLIPRIQTGRVFVKWPGQHIKRISTAATQTHIDPTDLRDADKISIQLPTIITTRLREKDPTAIIAHALSFDSDDDRKRIIEDIVGGVYRPYVGNTTVQNLFAGRHEFQQEMLAQISQSLEPFGLEVVSVHNNRIVTSGDVNVFEETARIAEAKIVAEATAQTAAFQRAGRVAAALENTNERIRLAELAIQVAQRETERDTELTRLHALVVNAKIAARLENDTKSTEAVQRVAELKAKLEADVAVTQQRQQLEQKRSTDLTATQVEAEQVRMKADGEYYAITRAADGERVKVEQAALAELARLEAVARGTEKTLMATAKGMGEVACALEGKVGVLHYLAIEKDMYARVAAEQAKGLSNMKTTIYGQGAGSALSEVLTSLGMNLQSLQGAGVNLPGFLTPVGSTLGRSTLRSASETTPLAKK